LETVREGKTGLFFNSQDKNSLIHTMKKIDQYNFKKEDFEKQIKSFNFENFKTNFLSFISNPGLQSS
jgi:hypothetical protein